MISENFRIKSFSSQNCRSLAFLLLLWILTPLQAQTLYDYQLEAASNNPSLRASYNHYLSSLEMTPQVSSLPDPEVSFAYFISPVETRVGPQRARISLTQMFPWFGTLKEKETGSLIQTKAQFESFRNQRNKLFFTMEMIWASIYKTNRQIELEKKNLEIVSTLVDLSLKKYETGKVSQVDVLRAQIEKDDILTKIALLTSDLELLIKQFNEWRNVAPDEEVILPESLAVSSPVTVNPEVLNEIYANNPSLNKIRLEEDLAENRLRIAGLNGKPAVGFGFDYIATSERTDIPALPDNGKDVVIARLSMKIPLFRSKYNAESRAADLNLSAARSEIINSKNSLSTSFYAANRDLNDAHRRLELYDRKKINRIDQALTLLMRSYTTDHSEFDNILELQRKKLMYELERLHAIHDAFVAEKMIRFLRGDQNINADEINYKIEQ